MENITGAQPCPICENEELFLVRLDATSYTASGAVLCQKCGYTKVLSWYKAKKNTKEFVKTWNWHVKMKLMGAKA